jgi:hypothetical protein
MLAHDEAGRKLLIRQQSAVVRINNGDRAKL